MKSYIIFLASIFFLTGAFSTAQAQDSSKITTLEFKVDGVCKMCKARIENAAYIKGVKMAEWQKETQMLKVVYKTKKVEEMEIHQAVAEAGHDTEKVKAEAANYSKLPGCCAFRDGVKVH